MTKHTQGPWHIKEKWRIEAADFGTIATLRGEISDYYATELDANARLIAAAPDMKSALDRVQAALAYKKILKDDPSINLALIEVVTAIAKAGV